ncbi:HlyD family type I secretion periplasmic adaptor subunit [Bradyrhizobium sp. Leo121]|uniref:HlyD family type I secretion periplasmic adaptor subunit n=1 Tax=Bradyrhizobium sp. Leo121 TaxID=1571195 RepID=UPI00102A3AA2|nr:HlyD family type I secretion periplasmic adaptor subunit [Bradyrhizobium sp. Leo121]RZN36222.1 HlyD family type I secretion periplasmic adaptor subunit [Bradyrhizobium sp. Leo121]
MSLLPTRPSGAASLTSRPEDSTLPALLEFQSPTKAIIAAPVPVAARGTIWMIGSMFAACIVAMGLIPIDRVVTAQGKVVSKAPMMVVQPLETSIVRSIDVTEGQSVHGGDMLARLDPTFAGADVGATQAQVFSLQAEVARMQAEVEDRSFQYSGVDAPMLLQAAIYAQRESERKSKLESYRQKIDAQAATAARSAADATAFRERLAVAQMVESMRKKLEALQVGSQLNALIATDNRLEIERSLSTAVKTGESAKAELAAMIAERDAYLQNWRVQIAQALSEGSRKLSDARESLNKALLRRQLIELHAERDATVLTVAKVSEGSVLQTGEQLITLVPVDAPLEIEANIAGRDNGFVHIGAAVAVKFDTLPSTQYGLAYGTVRTISADSFTTQDNTKARSGSVPVNPANTEPFYRSRITLDRLMLHDLPAGFHIMPGMPVAADIKVGKRTVMAYLLGRILPVMSEGMREP